MAKHFIIITIITIFTIAILTISAFFLYGIYVQVAELKDHKAACEMKHFWK